MKKKKNDIDAWLQEWEKNNQRANLAPSLSEEELQQLFSNSQKLPSVSIPPLPPDTHTTPRLRYAAVIALIVVGTVLLLINLATSGADTPLQTQLAPPAYTVDTLPATEPHSITLASPTPASPHHAAVAKADISSPSAHDNPLSEPIVPADTLCPNRHTISIDNIQYTALYCNNETCDTQRYLFQVYVDLNLV